MPIGSGDRCRNCVRFGTQRCSGQGELNITEQSTFAEVCPDFSRVTSSGLQVESQDPSQQFTATASMRSEVPASGFIICEDQGWIASEATYLYGVLEVTRSEKISRVEGLQPVFFYNQMGFKGARLCKDAIFKIGDKALRPSSKTLSSSGPPTLMSLEAGLRFLNGETVTVDDLYELALAGLKRFSSLNWDQRLYDVVTSLVIASYFYDLFGAFPITIIMGPFESGKTRLLLCIIYMGHRGMPILDPTEASIFRTAEAWKGFLGIDEFWDVSKEIERLLRATYKRGMKVPRIDKTKGGLVILDLFDLFGKVAVASPEPLPPNILSKGIQFQLRKMPDPNPERRDPEPRDFEEVRSKAYIARLTWGPEVKAQADRLDQQELDLSGRDYEVWKPLLTIAYMIGGKVWENVLSYAKESCEQKREESYEELKQVLEAMFELLREVQWHFPLIFTPKQIHDIIWEHLKDEYRVVKEKQEIEGETSEKYDYDTRRFEEVYRVHRIGRTYLRQLGLKGRRKERGTQYEIPLARDFHDLVVRYHPDLSSQERDYAKLVHTSKLMPEMSETPVEPDSHSEKAPSKAGNSEEAGINTASPTGNASPVSRQFSLRKASSGNACDTCIISKEPLPSKDTLQVPTPSQPQPFFTRTGDCAICRRYRELQPDQFGEFYICQECFDRQSKEKWRHTG